jgi:hypothetical protein
MDPCLLWARAGIVGSLAFVLGVVGHVSADGLLPGPGPLAALAVLSVVLSGPMLARPASRTRLMLMLVCGQTVIHAVLTVTAGHAGDAVRSGRSAAPVAGGDPFGPLPVVGGHRVGSLQDAFSVGSPSESGTTLAPALPVGHLVNDLSAHAPMMVAHLAAAVLVGLWLAHGERCLWTLLSLTGRRLVLAALLTVPVAPRHVSLRSYLRVQAPAGPRSVWLARPDTRRGPPLLAA